MAYAIIPLGILQHTHPGFLVEQCWDLHDRGDARCESIKAEGSPVCWMLCCYFGSGNAVHSSMFLLCHLEKGDLSGPKKYVQLEASFCLYESTLLFLVGWFLHCATPMIQSLQYPHNLYFTLHASKGLHAVTCKRKQEWADSYLLIWHFETWLSHWKIPHVQ